MKATTRRDDEKGHSTQDFYTHISLEELAERQGVKPVTDPSTLAGNFWPEDETAEEFIATLRQWRKEEDHRGGRENT
ncbi:MAG TPA: hypothetical protein VND68_02120 [Chloroflexia bacterium]|nr:hypothetical protein [Chloroflexia bacterium]